MNKVRIKLKKRGVKAMLKSDAMMGVCQSYANEIRHRCGAGYGTNKHVGKDRVNVSVYAATREAMQDNLENNTLQKMMR